MIRINSNKGAENKEFVHRSKLLRQLPGHRITSVTYTYAITYLDISLGSRFGSAAPKNNAYNRNN